MKRRREEEETEREGIKRSNSLTCLSGARQKSPTNADIISTLPDSLLLHILSFLPTEDSVATSILSSRWRPLCNQVQVLNLDEFSLVKRSSRYKFQDIVFRIWYRRSLTNPYPLRGLRLCWVHNCRLYFVETWLPNRIQCGMQELNLHIEPNPSYKLPDSVFFCRTLVDLKLEGAITFNPPRYGSEFPSLKILKLKVFYAKKDSLSTFLAACPVLQDLTLEITYDRDVVFEGKLNIIVLIPTLKRFHCHILFSKPPYKLKMNTPALKYFYFKGHLTNDFVVENMPSLVESVIGVEEDYASLEDYANNARDFIRPLCNVKSLEMSVDTAVLLLHASEPDGITLFHDLSSLKFCGDLTCDYAWHALRLLIGQAPKLQILGFELTERFPCAYSPLEGFLEEPQDVPGWLSSHLTTCHYDGFLGFPVEMELVRQILKAASVLKTMKIVIDSHLYSKEKRRIHEELGNFQRSSHVCQIEFDEGRFEAFDTFDELGVFDYLIESAI